MSTAPSDYPTKVVVEATADSYSFVVYSGNQVIASQSFTMRSRGRATSDQDDCLDEILGDDFEELASEISDMDLTVFGVAGELFSIRDLYQGGSDE